MNITNETNDDGERTCLQCGDTFNIHDGGDDDGTTDDGITGPICASCEAYEPGQCGECPECGSLSPWRCGCDRDDDDDDDDD